MSESGNHPTDRDPNSDGIESDDQPRAKWFDADELAACESDVGVGHSIDPESVEIVESDRHSASIDATCSRCGSTLRGSVASWNMIRTWPTAVELEGER